MISPSEVSRDSRVRTYDRVNSVVFLKTNEEFGGLSNMAGGFPLVVNGFRILTSEALYQLCRFPHMPEVQRLIIAQVSPMTAKMKTKPYRRDSRPDWNRVRVKIMRWCLRVKLAQNWSKFSKLLLATGSRPIVEQSRKDDFWGAKTIDNQMLLGMNVLGRLLMELREEVRNNDESALLHVEPLLIPDFLLNGQPIQPIASDSIRENSEIIRTPEAAVVEPRAGAVQALLFDQPPTVSAAPAGNEYDTLIHDLKPYPAYKDSGAPWLGQVPRHWEVRRNGRLFTQRNETAFPDLPILEVSLKTGVRVRSFDVSSRKQLMSDRDKYKRACRGDIAYNMMRMWQGAVGVPTVDGLVSPAYVVARPLPGTEARYFASLFRTTEYMGEVNNFSRGIVSDRNRLYWNDFKQITSPYPPFAEQYAIVRFLCHADRLIQRYIRIKKKLIALLNEQKQAVIHRAVTRSLNPNVRLKPSGMEWLGDVPEHWEIQRLKSLVAESVAGPYGSSLTKAMYASQGYRVYGQQQVIFDDFSVGDYYISAEKFLEMNRYRVLPHDVLVSVMGTVGRIAVVPETAEPGIINPRLVRYRPDFRRVRARYLQLAMQAPPSQAQLAEGVKGTTMEGLNMEILGKLLILVPPLHEQDAILSSVGSETQSLLAAISSAQRELDLLREYRTRLIADVVTGKLDVREAAAQLPEETEETEQLDEGEALVEGDEEGDNADLDKASEEAVA